MHNPLPISRPLVLVAAALLIDAKDRILLAQRPPGKALAELWEFPGGKLQPNETPEQALRRELREELGIETETADFQPFTFASHAYAEFHLLMPLYLCRRWLGEPQPREGQTLAWVGWQDLRAYPLPPADDGLVVFLEDWFGRRPAS